MRDVGLAVDVAGQRELAKDSWQSFGSTLWSWSYRDFLGLQGGGMMRAEVVRGAMFESSRETGSEPVMGLQKRR